MSGSGTIYFRADHELVARVIAEKLRRRAQALPAEGSFHVSGENRAIEEKRRA